MKEKTRESERGISEKQKREGGVRKIKREWKRSNKVHKERGTIEIKWEKERGVGEIERSESHQGEREIGVEEIGRAREE